MAALEPNQHKSRGMKKLIHRFGDLGVEIERRLRPDRPLSILEVGCGYGMALLDLLRCHGDRVKLFGISKMPEHGNAETMRSMAVNSGLFSEEELQSLCLPELFYFDVCRPWPLADNTFDFIYSQHAFLWFEDKILPLEEINRVMAEGGLTILDLQVKRTGPVSKSSIIIQEAGRELTFWSYIQSFHNITIKSPPHHPFYNLWRRFRQLLGKKIKSMDRRSYLEMRKVNHLDFQLEWIGANDLSEKLPGRKGQQSIYRRKQL